MALVNVTHKPVTGRARQFDGTLAALTEILSARPLANVTARCGFDAAGNFTTLFISGGAYGNIAVTTGEWVVFPTDAALPPISVTAAAAAADWQTVP